MSIKSTARILALVLFAVGVSASWWGAGDARAQDNTDAEAERHFNAGVKLLDDPDGPRYAEAYTAFRSAFELSRAPAVLGNLGLCAMKLERDGEALDAYRRYLEEAKTVSQRERQQILDDIKLIEGRMATVVLTGLEAGMLVIDARIPSHGETVVNRYGPVDGASISLRLHEGRHRLTLEHETKEVWSKDVDLRAGDTAEETYVPKAIEKSPSDASAGDFPVLPVVLTGATAAFAIATAITGGLALGRQSTFEASNDGRDPAVVGQIRDEGVALNVATDVFLVTTLAAAGVSTAFWVLWALDDGTPAGDADAVTHVTPWVSPFGVGVSGRF